MKILGLDLGTKTIGIAISDKLNLIAMPYGVIRFKTDADIYSKLDEIIKKEKIIKIILGFPKNMNNTIGSAGERSLAFKKILENRYQIEVILIDERLSTVEAENILIEANMRRMKRKKVIDGLAAAIILENYLNKKGE